MATRPTFLLASLAAFPLFVKSFLPSREHQPTNIESMGKRKLGQAFLPDDRCYPRMKSSVKVHPSTLTPQQLWDQHISTRTPAIIQGLPNDAEFKADRWTASSLAERAVRSGTGLLLVHQRAACTLKPYTDYQLAARSWWIWKQKAYIAVNGDRCLPLPQLCWLQRLQGNAQVLVEARDAGPGRAFGKGHKHMTTFSDFLSRLATGDSGLYLTTQACLGGWVQRGKLNVSCMCVWKPFLKMMQDR